MDGVIIEYKSRRVIKIIEQATQRRARQKTLITKKRVIKVNTITLKYGILIPIRNTDIFTCKLYSNTRSWKRKHTGKRAPKKQFERHPHRIKKTPQVHKYPIYPIKEVIK